MGFWGDFLESGFPLILDGAKAIADASVAGEDLNEDQLAGLWNARNLITTHGAKIAASSENTYDDTALEKLAEFALDTLEEAGAPVTAIPDFGAIAAANGQFESDDEPDIAPV